MAAAPAVITSRECTERARLERVYHQAETAFENARAVALGDALRRSAGEIAVIGGAEIYSQWMEAADRLDVTEVHARPEGDTRFAAIDPAKWEEATRVRNPAGPDDSADFSYVTYRRRGSR